MALSVHCCIFAVLFTPAVLYAYLYVCMCVFMYIIGKFVKRSIFVYQNCCTYVYQISVCDKFSAKISDQMQKPYQIVFGSVVRAQGNICFYLLVILVY